MCGVLGFKGRYGQSEHSAFFSIFEQSRVRGMHAYGAAACDETGEIDCCREFSISEVEKWARHYLGRNVAMIGHCRYATSGDYLAKGNNQPVILGDYALAFNGIVTQAPKETWESTYGVTCASGNDGEILLAYESAGLSIPEFVERHRSTFAGVWINNGLLFAYRNRKRPLYRHATSKGVFYASTADIVRRAIDVADPEPVKPEKVCRHD